MSIEQAIHEHWAATASLQRLLSAQRVTTGRLSRGATPYATIQHGKSRPALPTNRGNAIERIDVHITLWHDDYDAGRSIARQVEATMDSTTLTLPGSGRIAQLRRAGTEVAQHDDGLWQWTVELQATVYLG